MKIYKVGLPFIGMSSLMLLMSPLANAEMSNMDHGSMDMSGMDSVRYGSQQHGYVGQYVRYGP